MSNDSDDSQVVRTAERAAALATPPLLVLDAVEGFLDDHGIGYGPATWRRIGDGRSNITFLLQRGDRQVVLRRGPRPPLPPSTHDMLREARIQQILRPLGIPVPRILAVSDDTSLLGVPFYVMEALTGVVVTDHTPVGLAEPANRARIGAGMIDTLAQLHSFPVDNGPIYDLGRPDGYLERQVRRFASLWEINTTRSLPQVAAIATVLAARLPRSQRASVVHGDYRLGNVMFEPAAPSRVQAVLDWEMATLGDPLADLGYFLATYSEGGVAPTPLHLSPATAEPGYPSTDELAKRYAAATGLDLVHLAWYKALALWKAAIFCEAIYTRWLRGERPGDDFAPGLTEGVPLLLEQASAALDGTG